MPISPPLGPPQPKPLGDADIAANLEKIYTVAAVSQYGCYFFLNFFTSNDYLGSTGFAVNASDSDLLIQKYYQYPNCADVQLYLHAISALEQNAQKIFSGASQNYQTFVALDRTTVAGGNAKILVPYQTAQVLSAAFTHGLVTRLILNGYKQKWASIAAPVGPISLPYDLTLIASPPPTGAPSGAPAAMNAGDWVQKYLAALTTTLVNPTSWNQAATSTGSQNYITCLSYYTEASLQAVGIVMGWLAGDALTSDPTNNQLLQCQQAIWTLLNSKYTQQQLGAIMGYTFSYLSGFILSERTQAMISGASIPPAPDNNPSTAPQAILNALSVNLMNTLKPIQNNVVGLASAFFSFVLAEFYAISNNNLASAAKYEVFIEGFQQGLMRGADVQYQQLFEQGYQLGYTNGFRDGYSQGYSAGWTAGYAVGYQAGQNTWMSTFQNTTNGLTTLLNDAGTLGKLLNDAGTVGTVIASVF
jgi:hypothetical protein